MIDTKYTQYAQDVLSGNIVACEAIQLACKRYISWFNRVDMYFDQDACERVLNFIKKLKHFEGKYAGQYFSPTPCQEWILYNLFGWYWKSDNTRVINKALIMVARKFGKGLSLNTLIPMADGSFKQMNDIHVGDKVLGSNGLPTTVIEESDIHYRQNYKVIFADGSNVIADDEHNWYVKQRKSKTGDMTVLTTQQIFDYGVKHIRRDGKGVEYNFRVPVAQAIEFPEQELPMDPYALGLWLGDGNKNAPAFASTLKNDDYHIYDALIPEYGNYKIRHDKRPGKYTDIEIRFSHCHGKACKMTRDLQAIGVWRNKHIPEQYKRGSIKQRLALIQGLFDTDGSCPGHYGMVEFTQKNKGIIDDVKEILASLGIMSRIRDKKIIINGETRVYYRLFCYCSKELPVFRMKRKYDNLSDNLNKRQLYNSIVDIQKLDEVSPTKCIMVDNDDHTYLFGRGYTTTHNSFFAAAICLYGLIADNEAAAQVLNVANSREQAKTLFRMEQVLSKQLDPNNRFIKILRERITFDKTNSFSKVLSSDANGLDSYGPSIAILDETHGYQSSALYDVMISGQAARKQPLILQISTAGFNLNGFLYNYRTMCLDVLKGIKQDDSLFAAIYELDIDDDYQDENVWIKANPNLDITVSRKFLREQVQTAINQPTLLTSVLTKSFNVFCQSKTVWIPDKYVQDALQNVDLNDYAGEYSYIGVDLSTVSDLAGFALMIPPNAYRANNPDKWIFKCYPFISTAMLTESINSEFYKECRQRGYLYVCPGNCLDFEDITKQQYQTSLITPVSKVYYDQWQSVAWLNSALQVGLPCEPMSQGVGRFTSGTREFERLIRMGHIIIDANPITRWCIMNSVLREDIHGNVKPEKGGDPNHKIDMVICMIEALTAWLDEQGMSPEIITTNDI